MVKHENESRYKEIRNTKVFHDYFVDETYESGIILKGTEVKSIRNAKCQITDSFVRIQKGIVFLFNAYINAYDFGNLANHEPTRIRQLLLKKREIKKIKEAIEIKKLSVIPTKMYIKSGLIKLQIGICRGKKLYDKREDLKKKAISRDLDRNYTKFVSQ